MVLVEDPRSFVRSILKTKGRCHFYSTIIWGVSNVAPASCWRFSLKLANVKNAARMAALQTSKPNSTAKPAGLKYPALHLNLNPRYDEVGVPLRAVSRAAPFGVPNPVQGSQPGPAL